MKLKFLLFLMMVSTMLCAQEANRSLVITEARLEYFNSYLQFTNMGDEPLELSEYKLGNFGAAFDVEDVWDDSQWWNSSLLTGFMKLPQRTLEPGESFVITHGWDFGVRAYKAGIPGYELYEKRTQTAKYDVADMILHYAEWGSEKFPYLLDSITPTEVYGAKPTLLYSNWGNQCWFLMHNFAEGDSAVVDQVNGIAGRDYWADWGNGFPVAGVPQVTGRGIMVRKFSVKTGNNEFVSGTGLGDSEWIGFRLPVGYDNWRDIPWTVGSHANTVLDENLLEPTSDDIEVDFAQLTITVPWGIRRLDGIMRHMKKKPGIYWEYILNDIKEDSVYRSVRDGDKLIISACGNTLTRGSFDIIVNEPAEDANIVVPINQKNLVLPGSENPPPVTGRTQAGILNWPRVTQHEHGTDTITGTWHGLPNALRTDTLTKYLEKPANATWEFVWVDGVTRPDLKNGDKLRVVAQNGTAKEYFIQVQDIKPSHNASLNAITWPDIPEYYKGVFGWKGDTIPNFISGTSNYKLEVPIDVEGIPALVARKQDINSKLEVTRATSLSGTAGDRTVSFKVTAEDDSVTTTYQVEMFKQIDPEKQQPYYGEPFFSKYIQWEQFANVFMEIVNPGNQPLDMSNYMIAGEWSTAPNPAVAIQSTMGAEDWLSRYNKYVPGYKWVDSLTWTVNPGVLERDLSVNNMVDPGGTFTMGYIHWDNGVNASTAWWPEWIMETCNVQFNNYKSNWGTYTNPWGENVHPFGISFRKVRNGQFYLYKILNDSIKDGSKAANDPNDFLLIDVWGLSDGTEWSYLVTGNETNYMLNSWWRKPEIYKGNTEYGGSFTTGPNGSEWLLRDANYWFSNMRVTNNLGQHQMNSPTHYKSTVTSLVFKVSDGYSMEEEIKGITTGTTVGAFLEGLDKAHEDQSLTVKSTANGSVLESDAMLSLNDTLVVLSADSINTTKYILNVTEFGLSSNAVLTSNLYDIEIETQPKSVAEGAENKGSGIISGFDYGTQLMTVANNVTVPFGALMTIMDDKGAYVPFKYLNLDTTYINVVVNASTYFEVVAEDGITRIIYQLQPRTSQDDAFVESYVFAVSQNLNLISYVPRGVNVQTFLSYITPSLNASVKIVDKMGNERTEGTVRDDDKVVVTSQNGLITRVYHLAMLRTQYILNTTYLAYVLSDTYAVDQVDYVIQGATTTTNVSEFYSLIRPSMGATAVVIDADGNEKVSGDLARGDLLKVTSVDGHIEVMYELHLTVVSSKLPETSQIEIYPNPTNGKLNVRGVDTGSRIQVYNSTGAVIRDMKVQSSLEVLSIDDQPAGLYLIVIRNSNKLLGQYKVIKK